MRCIAFITFCLLHACPFFTNATFPPFRRIGFFSACLPPHTQSPPNTSSARRMEFGDCKLRAANSHATYTTTTTTTCFSEAKRGLLVETKKYRSLKLCVFEQFVRAIELKLRQHHWMGYCKIVLGTQGLNSRGRKKKINQKSVRSLN